MLKVCKTQSDINQLFLIAQEYIDAGKPVVIDLTPLDELNSLKQKKLLFGHIHQAVADGFREKDPDVWGAYDANDWGEILKSTFLKTTINMPNGKVLTSVKSRADITMKEMRLYIENIVKSCAERGVVIEMPEDLIYKNIKGE